MKRLLFLALLAVFFLPIFETDASAQRPLERIQRDLDKLRPRGRILREIFGDKEDREEAAKKEREAEKRRAEARTDARRRGAGLQPTPAKQPTSSTRNRPSPAGQNYRTEQPRSSQSRLPSGHPSRLEIVVRESQKPEGLVVEKIAKTGAAWQAGIRKNDLILSVGGLATTSKEAIGEIINVLRPGDQIEFEYMRKNKKSKVMVQLGDLPESNDSDGDAPKHATNNQRTAKNNNYRANDYRAERRNAGNDPFESVMDQSLIGSSRNARTRRANSERQNNKLVQRDWPVQPPTANGTRTPPTFRPAQPKSNNNQSVRDLQRQLEDQRRQIESLRLRLQEAENAKSNDSGPDLDSLEFDK